MYKLKNLTQLLRKDLSKEMNSEVVDIEAIVKFCVRLSLQACQMVKDCYKNNEVKIFMKGVNDPVTQADMKIQTMLIRGLRKICPNLKIVGQEEVDYQGQILTDYQALPHVELPKQVKFNQKYQVNDVCVWIDPIDNTKGFISGEAEAVTVLIGISYKNRAEIGIIGHPFLRHGNQHEYSPSVFLGCASQKFGYKYETKNKAWQILSSKPKHECPIIAMSPSRSNVIETVIMQHVKGKKLLAGGSGYKILLVIQGRADLLAYCDPNTKKWDTCAGEAIMKGLGGFFINTKAQQIDYIQGAKTYSNKQGILCGFHENLKEISLKICKQNMKQ